MSGCRVWMCVFVAVVAMEVSASAEPLNIALVDMARVMNAFPETAVADATIDEQIGEFEAERKDMLETYRALTAQFEQLRKDVQSPMWSDEERTKKGEEAADKLDEMRDHEKKVHETSEFRKKQINDQRSRLRERIIGKLHRIVEDFAKQNGYDLILDASEGVGMLPAVIYGSDKLDVTEQIIKISAPADAPAEAEGVEGDAAGSDPSSGDPAE